MSQEDGQVTTGLRVDLLSERYFTVHGAPLNPCEYGFLSLGELLKSLPYLVEVSGCCSSSQNCLVPDVETDFLFIHSCIIKKMIMEMMKNGSGSPGFISLPAMYGLYSTPTITTRSS